MTFREVYAAATHDWPVTVAMLLYFYESKIRYVSNDSPGALTWFAYGVANIGFVWGYFKLLQIMSKNHV